jgi:hypothetical protein
MTGRLPLVLCLFAIAACNRAPGGSPVAIESPAVSPGTGVRHPEPPPAVLARELDHALSVPTCPRQVNWNTKRPVPTLTPERVTCR